MRLEHWVHNFEKIEQSCSLQRDDLGGLMLSHSQCVCLYTLNVMLKEWEFGCKMYASGQSVAYRFTPRLLVGYADLKRIPDIVL